MMQEEEKKWWTKMWSWRWWLYLLSFFLQFGKKRCIKYRQLLHLVCFSMYTFCLSIGLVFSKIQ